MNGIIYRLIKHSFSWLLLWMSLFFLGRGLYIENPERMIGDLIVLSPSIAFCTVYIGGIILKGVLALYDFWKHNFIKKVAMERLRVEFYMNDVFMLSSIKTERGTAYPFARSFNFAIQATF